MGRRKIEIKAIKDDRNRSVTFLKRKGGLFKKAHELSVLCSVDVAVIIFGHNKKLYEFSSGDINETIGRYQYVCAHYGGPHEHKGPEDFNGKKEAGSDDEDDDGGSPRPESRSPPQHAVMAHHLQQQPAFQHMGTPHASPPMPNGAFPHRGPSPQAQNISRPGSRAHIRHPSGANLLPPQHPQMQVSQPQPPQQSYAYMPNPPIYNPQQAAAVMGPQPPQQVPPQIRFTAAPPQHPQPHPQMHPQQHAQIQQAYQQEQRRQSMPSNFPPQPEQRPPPPQQQQQQPQQQPVPSPQPQQQQFNSPPPPQPKPLSQDAKTHSIFTPIDDSRSLLARHWGSTSTYTDSKPDPSDKLEAGPRSQSIDVASINRSQANGVHPVPSPHPPSIATTSQPAQPQRTASTPVLPSIPPQTISRTNSLQTNRPRLRVEIPNESDEESSKQTGATSANPAATALTPIREPGHNGVVLPPPSPSTSALLSAGASGPPNPFARPPPPMNGFTSEGKRSEVETPASALPSKFVNAELLQSPSNFYSNWSFDRESNMLPSPLTFQTPVVTMGATPFDDVDRKRKISDGGEGGPEKRIKA